MEMSDEELKSILRVMNEKLDEILERLKKAGPLIP
jgi:hypothetical protein